MLILDLQAAATSMLAVSQPPPWSAFHNGSTLGAPPYSTLALAPFPFERLAARVRRA
jgi:hypothetical protein